MKYVIDVDGTICKKDHNLDYDQCYPLLERIKKINSLYDAGDTIVYFTARGMGRFSDNPEYAIKEFKQLTQNQLSKWGCKYHQLILGKPSGDIYIDDKGINDIDFFGEND